MSGFGNEPQLSPKLRIWNIELASWLVLMIKAMDCLLGWSTLPWHRDAHSLILPGNLSPLVCTIAVFY